jgi:hypothetical protein
MVQVTESALRASAMESVLIGFLVTLGRFKFLSGFCSMLKKSRA